MFDAHKLHGADTVGNMKLGSVVKQKWRAKNDHTRKVDSDSEHQHGGHVPCVVRKRTDQLVRAIRGDWLDLNWHTGCVSELASPVRGLLQPSDGEDHVSTCTNGHHAHLVDVGRTYYHVLLRRGRPRRRVHDSRNHHLHHPHDGQPTPLTPCHSKTQTARFTGVSHRLSLHTRHSLSTVLGEWLFL